MLRITNEQVDRIRERYAEGGISLRKLAEKEGVCVATVHQIVIRKTRKEPRLVTPAERLFGRVEKEPEGCWLWQGAQCSGGYGSMGFKGKVSLCHRVSYELEKGEIPKGMFVRQTCRKRLCVNPAHLVVTKREVKMW